MELLAIWVRMLISRQKSPHIINRTELKGKDGYLTKL
jgi:hypothetical protein